MVLAEKKEILTGKLSIILWNNLRRGTQHTTTTTTAFHFILKDDPFTTNLPALI